MNERWANIISAHHGNIATHYCKHNTLLLIKLLQGFIIMQSTISSTAHSRRLNSLEYFLCITAMTNPARSDLETDTSRSRGTVSRMSQRRQLIYLFLPTLFRTCTTLCRFLRSRWTKIQLAGYPVSLIYFTQHVYDWTQNWQVFNSSYSKFALIYAKSMSVGLHVCVICNGEISLHACLRIANQNGQWHRRNVLLHF